MARLGTPARTGAAMSAQNTSSDLVGVAVRRPDGSLTDMTNLTRAKRRCHGRELAPLAAVVRLRRPHLPRLRYCAGETWLRSLRQRRAQHGRLSDAARSGERNPQ